MKAIDKEAYLVYLMDTYQDLIFTLCYRKTGNFFEAEDLAQDTFLSAFRSLDTFDGQYEKAWLCRIAQNKCLDWLKRAERRTTPKEDAALEREDVTVSVEGEILEKEVQQKLYACCMRLKEPYREVALAYFCEEREAAEIARARGKPLRTVQTQIYRAKAQLKRIYGKE